MADADFAVDLATLAGLIDRMSACERELDDLTNAIEAQMVDLHGTWKGDAAQAQRLAHQEWEKGLTTMRTALNQLRADATTARENYSSAAETNLAMWEATR